MSTHPLAAPFARKASLREPTIAFQGAFGAFGEMAARSGWPEGEPRPMPTFERVVASVEAGISDFGLLPVWNTILGEVPFSREALAGKRIEVTGEITVPVELCLLARPGIRLEGLTYVGSHPAALAQCQRFLAAHPTLIACPAWDTAGAARDLADFRSPYAWYESLPGASARTVGAIAGAGAAERYGLTMLARGIQDLAENLTRFAILVRAEGGR